MSKTPEELEKEKLEADKLAKLEADKKATVGSTQTTASTVKTPPQTTSASASNVLPKPVESHVVKDASGKEIKPDFKASTHPGSVGAKISSDTLAKEREDIHNKIEETLRKYGGNEGEIPLGDDYWNLKNQYIARRG